MSRRILAWIGASSATTLTAGAFGLQIATREAGANANLDPVSVGLECAILGFAAVGALIATRQPGTRIGWVFLAAAMVYAADLLVNQYADYTMLVRHGTLWPGIWAGWLSDLLWFPANLVVMVFVFLLFPDGKPPSPGWRFVVWLAAVMCAVEIVTGGLHPGALSSPLDGYRNPAGIEGAAWISGLMIGAFMITLGCWGAALVSLVVRYRHGNPVERAQIRWFTLSALLVPASLPAMALPPGIAYPVVVSAMIGVPLSVGVAIFRYRLYEIDVIVRRTIIYAMLVASLAVVYLSAITVLGWASRSATGQSGALAVTVSTLLVAAAFQPLRLRIQAAVDRRFARQRYDAGRALAGLSGRLRERVELEAIEAEVLTLVASTVQPRHVSLWLRGGDDRW
jgi:hypothetical protein